MKRKDKLNYYFQALRQREEFMHKYYYKNTLFVKLGLTGEFIAYFSFKEGSVLSGV